MRIRISAEEVAELEEKIKAYGGGKDQRVLTYFRHYVATNIPKWKKYLFQALEKIPN